MSKNISACIFMLRQEASISSLVGLKVGRLSLKKKLVCDWSTRFSLVILNKNAIGRPGHANFRKMDIY